MSMSQLALFCIAFMNINKGECRGDLNVIFLDKSIVEDIGSYDETKRVREKIINFYGNER